MLHKKASNLLTIHTLKRQEFRHSICLIYNWATENISKYCAYGKLNNIDNCFSCKLNSYVVMRHYHMRYVTTGMMKEVCHDVQIEPYLIFVESKDQTQPRANKEANARLDIWQRYVCFI